MHSRVNTYQSISSSKSCSARRYLGSSTLRSAIRSLRAAISLLPGSWSDDVLFFTTAAKSILESVSTNSRRLRPRCFLWIATTAFRNSRYLEEKSFSRHFDWIVLAAKFSDRLSFAAVRFSFAHFCACNHDDNRRAAGFLLPASFFAMHIRMSDCSLITFPLVSR